METNYYQPHITEFFVGFEYESYEMYYRLGDEWDTGTLMWVKRTVLDINQEQFTGEGHKFKAIYHVSINNRYEKNVEWNKNIRVKYLDKADIQQLGFTKDVALEYQKSDLIICETVEESNEHYYKVVYAIKNKQLEVYDCESLIFVGTIKNKAECKKLMQQLNILKF